MNTTGFKEQKQLQLTNEDIQEGLVSVLVMSDGLQAIILLLSLRG
jgi:hypothetical protein